MLYQSSTQANSRQTVSAAACLAGVAAVALCWTLASAQTATQLYAPTMTHTASVATASAGVQQRPTLQHASAMHNMPFAVHPGQAETFPMHGVHPSVNAPKEASRNMGIILIALGSFIAGTLANRFWGPKPSPVAMMATTGETETEDDWKGGKHWSALTSSVSPISETTDILKVLPHRYPFLLVDKVIEFEPKKRAVGIKNVTMNEPHFTGHFPDLPIMPGVLQIEAMAQLGGQVVASCVGERPADAEPAIFFFAGIDGVRWKKPVIPGDTLIMEMELLSFKERFGMAKMKGKAYVNGKVVLEVKEFTFVLAK